MNFIENLENELQSKGITVYKVCKDIGINPNTVSNYKNGTIPKIDIVEKLSLYLGITTDKLILGKDSDDLTEEEKKILEAYRKANPIKQEAVRDVLKVKIKNSAESLTSRIG